MFKLLGIQVVNCQGFKWAVFDIGIPILGTLIWVRQI